MKLRLIFFACTVLSLSLFENTSQSSALSSVAFDSKATASPWKCTSKKDGLGTEYSCLSGTYDSLKTYWVLNVLCGSDLIARHSIYGGKPDYTAVQWATDLKTVKVRLDSKPIEEWKVYTKAQGKGLVFAGSVIGKSDPTDNSGTWKFLTRIATAKTLGFQGYDLNGHNQSALFNVTGSVAIAAKFSAMGCHI